ncbi:MAG: sigma-54 interaction domain-containing protein [Gemmatimonadota bacterium]
MARIFVDGSDLETAVAVRGIVEAEGHEVEIVASADEIEGRLPPEGTPTALVLTGSAVEGAGRLLAPFRSRVPSPPVLGFGPSGGDAGAWAPAALDERLTAPPDPAEVQVALQQQLERYRLRVETGIVGRTEAMQEVLERIHLLAPVHSTVLITGESGTGKELAARAIHHLSPRRSRPFIAMNCAAVPESLLESELFGHEKGAFTGATSRRKGMFELADGGTLLLDEIAEMPSPLQTRLLRVLETRRFMRVGGDVEIGVDVRVIAATNRDLGRAVREGGFRRDLYYRLNVLHLELPPLRERKSDIPILVRGFIRELSRAHDREFKGLAAEAMDILLDYDWPGNVRELRNLVESMVVLAPGSVIRAEDIPPEIRSRRDRAFLPIPAGGEPGAAEGETPAIRVPQMEFLFRTLVEMRIDLDDLRGEFERFRLRHPELTGRESPDARGAIEIAVEPGEATTEAVRPPDGEGRAVADLADGEAIRFRPGMTMSELEREAIRATLRSVGGNRRKAAERLQIGERTLYRKLREYGIED